MGLSVYNAIGFREICKVVLYDWRPEPRALTYSYRSASIGSSREAFRAG